MASGPVPGARRSCVRLIALKMPHRRQAASTSPLAALKLHTCRKAARTGRRSGAEGVHLSQGDAGGPGELAGLSGTENQHGAAAVQRLVTERVKAAGQHMRSRVLLLTGLGAGVNVAAFC